MVTQHPTLGRRWLIGDGNAMSMLYTENETNYERAFGVKNPRPYVKDAFGRYPDQQRSDRDQSEAHRHQGGVPVHARSSSPARPKRFACA